MSLSSLNIPILTIIVIIAIIISNMDCISSMVVVSMSFYSLLSIVENAIVPTTPSRTSAIAISL